MEGSLNVNLDSFDKSLLFSISFTGDGVEGSLLSSRS